MKDPPRANVAKIAYFVLKSIVWLKNMVKATHNIVAPKMISIIDMYDRNRGLPSLESIMYCETI